MSSSTRRRRGLSRRTAHGSISSGCECFRMAVAPRSRSETCRSGRSRENGSSRSIPGARLVHLEAVVKTQQERTAFVYGCGLASNLPPANRLVWIDPEGKLMEDDLDADDSGPAAGGQASNDRGRDERWGDRLFPAASSVFIPRGPDRQLEDRLVRTESPRSRSQVRLRHSPGRAWGRLVRPLVQCPARQRAAPGGFLPHHPRQRRASTRARPSDIPIKTVSPSCPVITRSPATGTWPSPWPPSRKKRGQRPVDA